MSTDHSYMLLIHLKIIVVYDPNAMRDRIYLFFFFQKYVGNSLN